MGFGERGCGGAGRLARFAAGDYDAERGGHGVVDEAVEGGNRGFRHRRGTDRTRNTRTTEGLRP
jgi:hypothetical protein